MNEIVCPVCFRHCRLAPGQTGYCRARINREGKSVCLSYGKVTSLALDPIEKKPFVRFFPGTRVLSVGSFGCNLHCPFCQNASISFLDETQAKWRCIEPKLLANQAAELRGQGCIGVAYTYNEPMIGYEYVRDTAKLVHEQGMQNVLVTNGSVCLDTLHQVLPYIDAMNIDLKGFTEAWYRKLGGDLQTVLTFIKEAAKTTHVELTTLIVPGGNDSESEMRMLAQWIASINRTIPLHVTRFFPRHNMLNTAPTDIKRLYHLADVARETLNDVLVGNV